MTRIPMPNFISVVLVVGALAGNAQIAGLDIFLVVAAPVGVALLTAPDHKWGDDFNLWSLIALLPVPLLVFRSLAVDPIYFDLYWLWPIKAVLLAFLLSMQRGQSWPLANDILLTGFAVLLLLTAEIEDGRLISFFGPNMLYRFFGVIFLMAVFCLPKARRVDLPFLVFRLGMSAIAMILTGSVGALLIFAIAIFVAWDSVKYLFTTIFGFIFAGAVAVGLWASRTFLTEGLGARITHKIENLDRDERYVTWSALIDQDTGWLGYNHSEFAWLWSYSIPYPHNAFVELYAFYGYFGAALALVIFLSFVIFRKTNYYFFLPFTVILVGSMISGELSDNFALLAFPILIAFKWKFFTAQLRRDKQPDPSLPRRAVYQRRT